MTQGKKTHEQFQRTLERKPDVPKDGDYDRHPENTHGRAPRDPGARQSEMAVSERGMNQEDRGHNTPKKGS